MRKPPLPESLPGEFSVRDAIRQGATPSRMRAKDLDARLWGVRIATGDAVGLRRQCLALSRRIPPHAAFSHVTAARLHDLPLPLAVERRAGFDVCVPAPFSRLHSRDILGHRLTLDPQFVTMDLGLRVTTPSRTWFDLGGVLGLDDLVAVGDCVLNRDRSATSRREMEQLVSDAQGRRGIRTLRGALDLLDGRCESRPESVLRLLLLRSALPRPVINRTVVQSTTGSHVRPDFLFVEEKLILEYQGDYHRTQAQWRSDMTRRTRLESEDYAVLELNADDLRDPTELLQRIARHLARRS